MGNSCDLPLRHAHPAKQGAQECGKAQNLDRENTGRTSEADMIILQVILAHFILWLLWIMAAGLIERYKKRPFTGLKLRLAQGFLAFFWLVDVYVNLTASTVLFMQLPPVGKLGELWEHKYRLTLTHRLKYNITQGGWRGNLALWMCRYLVDPWQPGHCGL